MAEETKEQQLNILQKVKWWHLLFLYPGIAGFIATSAPTVWQAYKAWRLEVNYSKVAIVEEQKELWQKNIECLQSKAAYGIDIPDLGTRIGVTLCLSGDALLRYQREGQDISYTWIKYPEAGKDKKTAVGRNATQLAESDMLILYGATKCAVLKENIVVRIYTPDGQMCLMEHVQLGSGKVISSANVLCSSTCGS